MIEKKTVHKNAGIKKPPKEPEIVFPGLILGASFGPPINLTNKK